MAAFFFALNVDSPPVSDLVIHLEWLNLVIGEDFSFRIFDQVTDFNQLRQDKLLILEGHGVLSHCAQMAVAFAKANV
ncbi:hypothetical protein D3C86_2168250 [compost metagenome]